MSRVLFSQGVHGDIVRQTQQRLSDLGFDPGGIDGRYGANTARAVSGAQNANGLPATGDVDVDTWKLLTQTPVPEVRDRALQLTAAFEGHGFTLAQGNFDGAGITWGIIGFTLKHGELRKIISRIQDDHPDFVKQAFGDNTDQLLQILHAPLADQLAFANSISLGANKATLAEPWLSAFRVFGNMPEVQAVQLEFADQDYFQPALQTASHFGLDTEVGLALAFDIHVQNGGVSADASQQIQDSLASQPDASEQDIRVIIANAVADNARNVAFREDVRQRKLTIATGSGQVHGESFVLRNWGLDDLPAFA